MSEAVIPTIKDLDPRFKPTVINILKTGQFSVADGCKNWTTLDTPEEVADWVKQSLENKVSNKTAFLSLEMA